MKKAINVFTNPASEKDEKGLYIFFLILLLVIILVSWGFFLNWGNIPFDFHDWAEVNAPRLAFLKDAITKGRLPLHMPDSSALRGVTDRYMALPDVILSPQVLLLRWMSVGTFILVHTWLMIALGFWGLLRLKRRFSLSLLSFTWIALLYFFNGHMLSHYAVGHVTWGGAFLLSWFAELVFGLIDGEKSVVWETKMAFLLFFIFLQGSFHQFVWCVIFLGFTAISNWKLFFPILRSGIAAGLLSAVRIIPPAMQMGAFDDDFLGGYRTPVQILNAFIKIIRPEDSLDQAKTGAVLGWWEFDIYIGMTGLVLIGLALAAWLLIRNREFGFPSLICPVAVLTLFSFRNLYMIMRFFRIPLFSGERVSSRFLLLPFIFVMTAGIAALQRRLKDKPHAKWGYLCLSIGLLPACLELWRHQNTWKVTEAVKGFPYTYTDLSIKVVANHLDQPYTTGLLIGSVISILTAAFLLIRARKANK
ncbi:MAG: hypothetical protein II969_00530 [Anaerolineaceae bacterium]|nr:hypothetical protein [Anaerolineaceae bacterium]